MGPCLIVTEAGGRITRLDGKPLVYNRERPRVVGVVASSPGIHDALVRAVRG